MTNLYLMCHHHRDSPETVQNEWIPSPPVDLTPPISRTNNPQGSHRHRSLFVLDWQPSVLDFASKPRRNKTLTGQPAQVQLEPQPQEPEEAQPQPDMVMMVLSLKLVCVL